MLKRYLMSVVSIVAFSAISAHADSKDDIQAAVQKLSDAGSYSWTTTTKTQGGGGFNRGPVDGKTQKDGLSEISGSMRDSKYEMLLKGDKVLINLDSAGWKTPDEAAANDDQNGGGPSPARFMGFFARMFRTPVDQAKDNLGDLQNIQKTDDGYTADLTPDAAKAMLSFRRRPTTNPDAGNGDMPQIDVTDPKGTVKMTIKDGNLTEIEFHVTGSISFNGGDPRDVDRTMTTDFKDIGSTTITVPDDAKAKLGS
jgi:hypothetical protein